MAEVAAAFYTVETVLEGAAVGAVAVARPTVPVVVRFHKINSPSPALAVSSHSINCHRGRAYVFGGDRQDGSNDNAMHILTLPTDLALSDTDYRSVEATAAPARPLAPYTDDPKTSPTSSNVVPVARAAHASTSIGSNIFIFGGRAPQTSPSNNSSQTPLIEEQGTVHVYSVTDDKWTTLIPNISLCTTSVPDPRTYASMTSSPHPSPQSNPDTTAEMYGTLFLHGGYDNSGTSLRDTWAFDVSSRAWSRWPSLPAPSDTSDLAGEGRIYCAESRLWRVGDAGGKMAYLDLARDVANDFSGKSEIGVTPKSEGWTTLSPRSASKEQEQGEKQDTIQANPTTAQGAGASAADSQQLPVPQTRRQAGFLPTTTGAGREFLLYFLGDDHDDLWTFQITSDKASPAVVKDKIRKAVGAKTGEHGWAKCDVVQSSKQEGEEYGDLEVKRPQKGLVGFAVDRWMDWGAGAVVVWGGKDGKGEVRNEGWVLTVE